MVLDITFKNEGPRQIQKVNRVSLYPHAGGKQGADGKVTREAIIYSEIGIVYIQLKDVTCITFTND